MALIGRTTKTINSFQSNIVRERRILEIKFSFLFEKFNFLNIEKFANTEISDKAI